MSTSTLPVAAPVFVTTQWTMVLAARGGSVESKVALGELCAAYYAPVQAFIRRGVRDNDAARELTQEFFARLLARQGLDTLEQGRGRFRSFLLGAVKHFLADMRDRRDAVKRGSGVVPVPIEPGGDSDTSPGLQLPDGQAPAPDREFDRKWALTVLERALVQLAGEHAAAGRKEHFEILKPWLTGDSDEHSQAEAARQLGSSEGAVKVAVHRLRRRFRELVKGEIAGTVGSHEDVQEELRYLLEVLG